jgi:uncharacterized protein (DUF2147 family)
MRLICVLLFLLGAGAANAATGFLGDWKTPTSSVVRVFPCGSDVCVKVVKLDASAPETTDKQNPDAALRGRSLCGLTVGTGFHAADAEHLAGGLLYDPKSGHTYHGTIAVEGDALKLHGYIGIALFGRTEMWQRVLVVEACR